MRAFLEIVLLELRALWRSRALPALVVAAAGWVAAFPGLAWSDGTADGARQLLVRYGLGGALVLSALALVVSATASLARERAAHRLQLTLVRPVRHFTVALAKVAAHVAAGALVLAAACLALALGTDLSRPCSHVLTPVLPSPQAEAQGMYEVFMRDPATPEEIRKAPREAVVRLLARKARDRYEAIGANRAAAWNFGPADVIASAPACAVRIRFSNQMSMRQDACGEFELFGRRGSLSNQTQTVVSVPLEGKAEPPEDGVARLRFENRGGASLLLRPRQDLALLVPADSFGFNLLRAWIAMTAVLAAVVSLAVFLSAGLGRPVALFAALVLLAVGEMSPSVSSQYADELGAGLADRVGLAIVRTAEAVLSPVSAASPLEALAEDERLETGALLRLAAIDLAALPLAAALLCAWIMPRKQEG